MDDLERSEPVDFVRVVHKSMFDALHGYMTGEAEDLKDSEGEEEGEDEEIVVVGELESREAARLSVENGSQASGDDMYTGLDGGKSHVLPDEGELWETIAVADGTASGAAASSGEGKEGCVLNTIQRADLDEFPVEGTVGGGDKGTLEEAEEAASLFASSDSQDSQGDDSNVSSEDEWDDGDDDLG